MKTYAHGIAILSAVTIFLSCLVGCQQAPASSSPEGSSLSSDSVSSATTTPDESGAPTTGPGQPSDIDPTNTLDLFTDQAGVGFVAMSDAPSIPTVTQTDSTKSMLRFMFTTEHNPNLPFHVACHISSDSITAILPSGIDLSGLIVDYAFCGEGVFIGDQPLVSGVTQVDFRHPVTLRMIARDKSETLVTVKIETLYTGLPSLAITTENGQEIVDRETKVPCTFYLGGGDKEVAPYSPDAPLLVDATIKGRGNTTWGMPKKSWNVTLSKKNALLDLPASKKWSLLANYQDKSLLRNYMAVDLAERMGMDAVMKARPVDVWLNGQYWGNYTLMEKIEVEENRINITEFDESLPSDQIGYHCEVDGHVSEISDEERRLMQNRAGANYNPVTDELWFKTNRYGIYVAISEPEPDDIRDEDIRYIMEYYNKMEDAFASGDADRISQYIDQSSFIDWFLVEETFKNCDSGLWSSCHMYKDANGKMHMGPVWDFDMSVGNANYGGLDQIDGYSVARSAWFRALLEEPSFNRAFKARWDEIKPLYLDTLPERLATAAKMIDMSQTLNFKRWDILDKPVGANPDHIVRADTFDKQIQAFKNFWIKRIYYLSQDLPTL